MFIYIIPDRDWDLERKIKIEQYLLNEVMNSNIDEEKVQEAINEFEEKENEEETKEAETPDYLNYTTSTEGAHESHL